MSGLFRSLQALVRRGMRQGSADRPCMYGPALPGWLGGSTLSLHDSVSFTYATGLGGT